MSIVYDGLSRWLFLVLVTISTTQTRMQPVVRRKGISDMSKALLIAGGGLNEMGESKKDVATGQIGVYLRNVPDTRTLTSTDPSTKAAVSPPQQLFDGILSYPPSDDRQSLAVTANLFVGREIVVKR